MDTKDSGISEMIVKDSGISEIGTKDSEILKIGTKDSGSSEGSDFSKLLEAIREKERPLREDLTRIWKQIHENKRPLREEEQRRRRTELTIIQKLLEATHIYSSQLEIAEKTDIPVDYLKLKGLSQEWNCVDKSVMHREKFEMMQKHWLEHPGDIRIKGDVRVIFMKKFLIGEGSGGTCVYLGLGNDGYGKAVKRILKYSYTYLALHEKNVLNNPKAKKSKHVVKYWNFVEEEGEDFVYLILDLCEQTLTSFVKSTSLDKLHKALPEILRQILNGLSDLHSSPSSILHRDLKPSNVLRDVEGKFMIADFGISQILESVDESTHSSLPGRGTYGWSAPESLREGRYKKESDIMSAGMVAYYVATKGEHVFGTKEYRLKNLSRGNPVGLKKIDDVQLEDLLSWMLQHEPKLRPSANEALKHPYLQSNEEKFDMLCDVGSQPEIKQPQCQNSDVRKQLGCPTEWMNCIDDEILKDFKTYEVKSKKRTVTYDSSWSSCLRFIRNVHQHWHDKSRSRLSPYINEGNYKEYVMQRFPELPLLVYKIIRSTDWKTRPNLKKHFTNESSTPNTVEFKERFLTKDHKMKDSVHENLKSFPWLCGKYGTARPNDEMNYHHMYLEVDESKTEDVLKQEIDNKFEGKASDYIELRYVDPQKNPVTSTGAQLTSEITGTDHFQFLKKKFLTDDFKMSNDVHKKLKSFDWFCGKCGTAGPTDQMPYLHLYMVVDYANRITDHNMKQEINEKLGWQASKYIEFRPNDPSKVWKVRPLYNKRLEVKRDDIPYMRSIGTLTMFRMKDGKQYALSCFHVGYEIGRIRKDDVNLFLAIQDEIEVNRNATQQFMEENKYYLSDDDEAVGNFSHFDFGPETDIMAIKVDEVKMKNISDEMENYSHDVFSSLFLRKHRGEETKVQKAQEIFGNIEDLMFNFDDEDGRPVFCNAVLVKSDVEFLMDGDSGSLVYFCDDENKKKRPFAYGVAELSGEDQNGKVETFYICLRLKDALEKLELTEKKS